MHGVLLVWRTVQLMHIKTEQEPPSGGADLVYIFLFFLPFISLT